jgi:hypothetical protein
MLRRLSDQKDRIRFALHFNINIYTLDSLNYRIQLFLNSFCLKDARIIMLILSI